MFDVSFKDNIKSPDMNPCHFTLFTVQAILGKIGFSSEIPFGKLSFYAAIPFYLRALFFSFNLMLLSG